MASVGRSLRRYRYAYVPVRPATLVAGGAVEGVEVIHPDTQGVRAGLAEGRGRCGLTIVVGLRLLAKLYRTGSLVRVPCHTGSEAHSITPYPPGLRVRGLRRTASHVLQDALQNLVSQGTITPEEALEAVESAEGRRF